MFDRKTTHLLMGVGALCGVVLSGDAPVNAKEPAAATAPRAAAAAARAAHAKPAAAARQNGGKSKTGQGAPSPAAARAAAATSADAAQPMSDSTFETERGKQYPVASRVMLPIGKLAGEGGTMSFWLTPEWQAGSTDDAAFLSFADGRLSVLKNVDFLRFEFGSDPKTTGGIGTSIGAWKAGEPHQVATTWAGNHFSLYIDGRLVSETIADVPIALPADGMLAIGSAFPAGRPVAAGTISTVAIQRRPLSAEKIAKRYQAAVVMQQQRTATR